MQDRVSIASTSTLGQWLCLGLAMLAVGCGGKYEAKVHGKVSIGNDPLTIGTVSFHPTGGGAVAYARIQSDGTYTLQTGQSGGLNPGHYQVTVVANEPPPADLPRNATPPIGKLLTPRKYSRPSTTDLEFDITVGSNEIDLKLESS